jgi:hypothetical protein
MKYAKNAFLLALAVGVTASQAAAVDVTATVTDIGAQLVPIGLIGVAVLGIFVAVKAFHWVRRALS